MCITKDAHAIRLHNEITSAWTRLLRSLGLAMQLEFLYFFASEDTDNRRPDIKIQNPFGEGRQIILDVAVTGVDGLSRRKDDDVDALLNSRFNEKNRKYEQVTTRSLSKFLSSVFSHTGQTHHGMMALIRPQIDNKLQLQIQQRQLYSTFPILKVRIRKLSVVINIAMSSHILDRSRKMVDLLDSTQRDWDFLPDNNVFSA